MHFWPALPSYSNSLPEIHYCRFASLLQPFLLYFVSLICFISSAPHVMFHKQRQSDFFLHTRCVPHLTVYFRGLFLSKPFAGLFVLSRVSRPSCAPLFRVYSCCPPFPPPALPRRTISLRQAQLNSLWTRNQDRAGLSAPGPLAFTSCATLMRWLQTDLHKMTHISHSCGVGRVGGSHGEKLPPQ